MDRKRGKKAAFAILKENKIKAVTLDNIVFLLGELGYDIIDCSAGQKEELDAIVNSLYFNPVIFSQNAFSYNKVGTNISTRRIRTLCEEDRIPGATRFGRAWAIPFDSVKPEDKRVKTGKYIKRK